MNKSKNDYFKCACWFVGIVLGIIWVLRSLVLRNFDFMNLLFGILIMFLIPIFLIEMNKILFREKKGYYYKDGSVWVKIPKCMKQSAEQSAGETKTYRVFAKKSTWVYLDVDAHSAEEARDIACETDDSEFVSTDLKQWAVDPVEDIEVKPENDFFLYLRKNE